MAKKSLFDKKYDNYTDVGNNLDREVTKMLEPVYEKYMKSGYSPRDITYIITQAASLAECYLILQRNSDIAKKQRERDDAKRKKNLVQQDKEEDAAVQGEV